MQHISRLRLSCVLWLFCPVHCSGVDIIAYIAWLCRIRKGMHSSNNITKRLGYLAWTAKRPGCRIAAERFQQAP